MDVVVTSHATSKNATWREQWKQCMEKLIHSLIQFFRWTFDSEKNSSGWRMQFRRSYEDLNCSHEAFQVRTTSHLATWSFPRYHHFIIHTTQSTLGRNSFPTNKRLARARPTLPNKRLPTTKQAFAHRALSLQRCLLHGLWKKMKSNMTRSRTYNDTFYIILYTF